MSENCARIKKLPPGELPVPLFDVVANCITIRGSFVGTRQDMAEALAFAAGGKVKSDIEVQYLGSINEIFARLKHGEVASRIVLDFTHGSRRIEEHSSATRDFVLATAGEFEGL
jgi:D-arabinose 1-dehydrogenase-like Zn-dependent alcohol dehydrogenase